MELEGYAWHDPKELQTAPPFSDLYGWKEEDTYQQNVLVSIIASMREDGFQEHHPVIGWRQRGIVIDGETRRRAAIEARIDVLVRWMDFDDEYAALTFALAQQGNRRNIHMDDAAFRRARRALESSRGRRKGGRPATASSAEETAFQNAVSEETHADEQISKREIAATLGYLSVTKVDDDRLVEAHGGPELNKLVDEGKIGIKPAARRVRAERKAAQAKPERKEQVEPANNAPAAIVAAVVVPSPEANKETIDTPREILGAPETDRRVYEWLQPRLAEIKSGLVATVGPPNLARVPPLYKAVWALVNLPPLKTLPPCHRCKGKAEATCKTCFGCGYRISK